MGTLTLGSLWCPNSSTVPDRAANGTRAPAQLLWRHKAITPTCFLPTEVGLLTSMEKSTLRTRKLKVSSLQTKLSSSLFRR